MRVHSYLVHAFCIVSLQVHQVPAMLAGEESGSQCQDWPHVEVITYLCVWIVLAIALW